MFPLALTHGGSWAALGLIHSQSLCQIVFKGEGEGP